MWFLPWGARARRNRGSGGYHAAPSSQLPWLRPRRRSRRLVPTLTRPAPPSIGGTLVKLSRGGDVALSEQRIATCRDCGDLHSRGVRLNRRRCRSRRHLGRWCCGDPISRGQQELSARGASRWLCRRELKGSRRLHDEGDALPGVLCWCPGLQEVEGRHGGGPVSLRPGGHSASRRLLAPRPPGGWRQRRRWEPAFPRRGCSRSTSRPFYILGEVARPGGYAYAGGMRVLSAVAAAQGYTYRANQQYVIITRNGEEGRADILSSIQPDDIIRVP